MAIPLPKVGLCKPASKIRGAWVLGFTPEMRCKWEKSEREVADHPLDYAVGLIRALLHMEGELYQSNSLP